MGMGVADKRIFFLINPQAGGGSAAKWWAGQRPVLDARGIDYFWEFTASADSTVTQIKRAVMEKNAEVIIVAGGDGSLFNTVNAIISEEKLISPDLILGLCPIGSGCDFSRCAYGGRKITLIELLEKGSVIHIDLACCDYISSSGEKIRSYYSNSFDMGAGADTCSRVNAEGGRIKRITKSGKLAFLLSALKVLLTFKYSKATVEADGITYKGQYLIAGVANGQYIGGGMLMFPDSRLDDGWLDVLLVERRSKLEVFRTFPLIYSGRHIGKSGIVYTKAKRISIHTERALDIELDGEVPGTTDVEISVLPHILPLLIPAKD